MKNFRNIIFVILSSFIFPAAASGQPPAGDRQSSGKNVEERVRRSPAGIEEKADLDRINVNPANVYELRCRGINAGGTLSFQTVDSKVHSSGATVITLELSFSPSLEAAGANSGGLLPGECSWVDRPISRDKEPWRVRFETPANAQLKQAQSGSRVDRSATAAESYADANTIPIYLASPNRYWSFYVISTGRGYFEAMSHRHWKKFLSDRMVPRGGVTTRPF
jgi:hypothetical protein